MKYILLSGIRFYQKYISVLKTTKCPYYPSCSEYGYEAVSKYGAFKGSLMPYGGSFVVILSQKAVTIPSPDP